MFYWGSIVLILPHSPLWTSVFRSSVHNSRRIRDLIALSTKRPLFNLMENRLPWCSSEFVICTILPNGHSSRAVAMSSTNTTSPSLTVVVEFFDRFKSCCKYESRNWRQNSSSRCCVHRKPWRKTEFFSA